MTDVVEEKLKTLTDKAKTDSSGRWVSTQDLEDYTEVVIKECINIVKLTPKHCAFTTHDLGIVECTIDKTVATLKKHFNL